MRALFEKYKDFIMEVIHFGMVGVINTFLGWVIMAVLYNLIPLGCLGYRRGFYFFCRGFSLNPPAGPIF